MTFLGRFLQFVGWAWAAAGFFAPMAGVEGPPILIGLILVFVARAIRAQAARREPEEPEETPTPQAETGPVERPLNTERTRVPEPQSRPEPVVRAPTPAPEPEIVVVAPSARDEDEGIIDRIARSGRAETGVGSSKQRVDSARHATEPTRRRPMSSEEMIAAARKRWDSKPRDGR